MPPSLAKDLKEKGFEARHIREVGFTSSSDISIFELAEKTNEIIITHDLDFSTIHSLSGKAKPSVIQIRIQKISKELIMNILSEVFENYLTVLDAGAMLTITKNGVRLRDLSIIKKS